MTRVKIFYEKKMIKDQKKKKNHDKNHINHKTKFVSLSTI